MIPLSILVSIPFFVCFTTCRRNLFIPCLSFSLTISHNSFHNSSGISPGNSGSISTHLRTNPFVHSICNSFSNYYKPNGQQFAFCFRISLKSINAFDLFHIDSIVFTPSICFAHVFLSAKLHGVSFISDVI